MDRKKEKIGEIVVGTPDKSNFKGRIHSLRFQNASKLLVAVLLCVVLIIAGLLVYKQKHTNAIGVCSTTATDPLMLETARHIKNGDVISNQRDIAQIKKLKNYQKDQNCLIPITLYYINTSDTKNARATLSQLEPVYNPQKGLNPYLSTYTDLKKLQTTVAFMEKNDKHLQKNFSTIGDPPK